MKVSNHCSRRMRERVGIRNRRRQQSWLHRRMNTGKWRPLRHGVYRVYAGRWTLLYDAKTKRVVTIWEVQSEG
jgi:hypothetical protein